MPWAGGAVPTVLLSIQPLRARVRLPESFWGKLMVSLIFVSASDELKNKTVCENQELKLHCHPSKFLNIYSASYGRRTQEPDICFSEAERLPPFGTCVWFF